MSGPSTAVYETTSALGSVFGGISIVVLAARAIKEAHAMHGEYGDAYQKVCERERSRIEQRQRLQEAQYQHLANLHQKSDRLQARLARLQALVQEQQGDTEVAMAQAQLLRPSGRDEKVWEIHLGELEEAIRQAEGQLAANQQLTAQAMLAMQEELPDNHQLLTAYAQQNALQGSLTADELDHYQALSRHLISRLERAAGEPMPVRIEALVRQMLLAHDTDRAEALASELRLEIQRANQARQQQKADTEEASMLLSKLADGLPEEVRLVLEQVAAGAMALDEPTRAMLRSAMEEVEAARKLEEQQAVSVVLEQSLRDLGYEVDDISQTLFVSGGVVHFQKTAWQHYHVRMRVSPDEKSVNFNVVRAAGTGDEAQDKRLDYLAEDRWCAEFPTLLKTLEARGVQLKVTRLLQAGEVPVQVVDAATLPATRKEEERHPHVSDKQMKL